MYFPFTILKEYYICWIEYVLTATVCAYIMYLFRIYHRMSLNKEQNYFDWRILVVLSVLFAVVSNYEKNEPFEYSQFIIRVSIILEAFAMLPQLKVMRNDKFVSQFMGQYLLMLSFSWICRIAFWFIQVKLAYNYSTYYTLIVADLLYIVFTCDFVYNYFKHRNSQYIPYI